MVNEQSAGAGGGSCYGRLMQTAAGYKNTMLDVAHIYHPINQTYAFIAQHRCSEPGRGLQGQRQMIKNSHRGFYVFILQSCCNLLVYHRSFASWWLIMKRILMKQSF